MGRGENPRGKSNIDTTELQQPRAMVGGSSFEAVLPDLRAVLFRGVVWAFVGALYAALFLPVFVVTSHWLPDWAAVVIATVAASAVGALVYSSSRLAVLVAMAANFVVFPILVTQGISASPWLPVQGGVGAGALVGLLYGMGAKESNVYRADAKLLAGVVAGLLVSVIAVIWQYFLGVSSVIWLVTVLAPICGLIYVQLCPTFVVRFSDLLPRYLDAAVAGAIVGGFIGFGLWVMGGVVLGTTPEVWTAPIQRIAQLLPQALPLAAIASFILGLMRSLLKVQWKDMYDEQ